MARIKSIVKVQGLLDDVVFYQKNGKFFARRYNPLAKFRIMNAPEFARSRENMQEFGGCVEVCKSLKEGISPIKKKIDKYGEVKNRLMGLFKRINLRGVGVRGERSFDLYENRYMIDGFEFNLRSQVSDVFNAPYTYTPDALRNSAVLNIPPFDAKDYVSSPDGASHFRILSGICVLSNFVYNSVEKKYLAVNTSLNEMSQYVYSDYYGVKDNITLPITINVGLDGSPLVPTDVVVLGFMGIEFYQYVDMDYYPFAQDNALRIEKAF